MDLTTVTRVEGMLNYGGDTVVGAATFLGKLITLYSEEIAHLLSRTVTAATYTEYHDASYGQSYFHLKAFPVTAMSAVNNDTSRDFDGDDIASDNYTYDPDNGDLIIDKVNVSGGPRVLKVIYAGGMATNTTAFIAAYPDIAEAVDIQVKYHYDRREELGSTSISMGDGSRGFIATTNILPLVREVISKHTYKDIR